LEEFSEANPPPNGSLWTLDALFSLPRLRIKYYHKLYGRLLKTAVPGQETRDTLVSGIERLEELMRLAEERATVPLSSPSQRVSADSKESQDEVVVDTRSPAEGHSANPAAVPPAKVHQLPEAERLSLDSATSKGSMRSSG
jgi:hypothetical protein